MWSLKKQPLFGLRTQLSPVNTRHREDAASDLGSDDSDDDDNDDDDNAVATSIEFESSGVSRRNVSIQCNLILPLDDHRCAALVANGLFRPSLTSQSHTPPPTFNHRTIKAYEAEWDWNNGYFIASIQGKHAKVKRLLEDPQLQSAFTAHVEEQSEVKNLATSELTTWVNNKLFRVGETDALVTQPVSERTVLGWLHRTGFSYVEHQRHLQGRRARR